MKNITKRELVDLGYSSELLLIEIFSEVERLESQGVADKAYLLKRIQKLFGKPEAESRMNDEPLPLREAIHANTEAEQANLAKVRKSMSEVLSSPIVTDGAIMPDACPTGGAVASMPVGGVVVAKGAIIPSAHSADICCSMHATFYLSKKDTSDQLDVLQEVTRFGAGGRAKSEWVDHDVLHEDVWGNPFLKGLRNKAEIYLADQGDGNHFAYLGEVTISEDILASLERVGYTDLASKLKSSGEKVLQVLVTHHGSRGLGSQVFKRGQAAAEKQTSKGFSGIPEAATWLKADSREGEAYWDALQYVERWTRANHQLIHDRFLVSIDSDPICEVGNTHNFVWEKDGSYIHGKGATPAWKDERGRPLLGLIPMNMAEPILLVIGGDNKDYLSFAPHGAGRNESRTALMSGYRKGHRKLDKIKIEDAIERGTEGVDVRWYSGKPDLTETPIAYKSADSVRVQIDEFSLAMVIAEIMPKGCIMAGIQKSWKEMRAENLSPKQLRQMEHRSDRRNSRQNLKKMVDEEW